MYSMDKQMLDYIKRSITERVKAKVSVSQIGDALVVSITAIQDIVYTYTYHFDNYRDFITEPMVEYYTNRIIHKCLKRYKRYIKNLFFKEQKRLDILDTSLYTR